MNESIATWQERMGPGYIDGGADLPEEVAMKAEIADLRAALARRATAGTTAAAQAIDALDGLGYSYDSEIGWLPPKRVAGTTAAPSSEPDRAAFEAQARYQGARDFTLASDLECANGWFPATYRDPMTELAWRVWANKRAERATAGNAAPTAAEAGERDSALRAEPAGQHDDGWPGEIYLNTGEGTLRHFSEYDEVDWCDHPQGESDVRYVRADVSPAADIGALVNRFLGWPLPDGLCPGVEHPIGTHLLSADQARAMLEYVLAARCRAEGGVTCNNSSSKLVTPAATAAPGDLPPLVRFDVDGRGNLRPRDGGGWVKFEDVAPFFASNAGAAIPEGFALVPCAITDEMIIAWAGRGALEADKTSGRNSFQEAWEKLLAAAPSNNSPVGAQETA